MTEVDGNVQQLKAKRGCVKAKLTRTRNFIESIDMGELDSALISNLELRLNKIEPLWDEFNELQSQIEVLESRCEDDVRDEFETSYFELISNVKLIIKEYERGEFEVAKDASVVGPNQVGPSSYQITNNTSSSRVKLPPIKLPTFNGEYCNWLEFRDAFEALVNNESSLTGIEKFYYLRTSLSDKVKDIIKSIEISSANYTVAWQCLVERYENKNLIVYNHVRAIFEQHTLLKESHIELRNLYDNTSKHLRSLKNLGEKTDSWDRLIIFIISNKFDPISRRDWESFKYGEELPTMDDLNKFLKSRCAVLERLALTENKRPSTSQSWNKRQVTNSFATTNFERGSNLNCYYCQENHMIYKCESFLKLDHENRMVEIKRLKLCLNCLRPFHMSWRCKAVKCLKCHKPHNILLHLERDMDKPKERASDSLREEPQVVYSAINQSQGKNGNSVTVNAATNNAQVLLSTAMIKIRYGNNTIICRALLDCGSQSHILSENMCKRLKCKTEKISHQIKGIGQTLANIGEQVRVSISSCCDNFKLDIKCLVLSNLTDRLPAVSFSKEGLNIPINFKLADPTFNTSGPIDVLLGASVFWEIMCTGQERLGLNLPVMQSTKLGWIIAGDVNLETRPKRSISYLAVNSNDSLATNLERFWNVEEVKLNKPLLSVDEKYCEMMFKNTTKRNTRGNFIVEIPFKQELNKLGRSYEQALRRFEILEGKLMKNSELRTDYLAFMAEYENLDHMRSVEGHDNMQDADGYFLPHHAVIKAGSITTKCRVVFDASAKTSSGLSLNDVQHVGPTLQQDIFSILIRFRKYKYVMTGDISKMYRQILVNSNQTKYQRILWRKDPSERIKIYEINRVVYGNASSPYIAVRCLFQLALDNEKEFPVTCHVIKNDFYMDDVLTGANTKAELLDIQSSLVKILLGGGFELRKFLCNSKEMLKQFKVINDLDVSILQIGENEQTKTLGVYWDANNDLIGFNHKVSRTNKLTKRTILSVICQVFDPLGLLGPIIIVSKLIMQELWQLKLEWDEEVPKALAKKWLEFQNDLPQITEFKIPRQTVLSEYIKIEYHGFCDASERAYGACCYIRCCLSADRFISKLLCAKSRVAPLKTLSIPRLELCGAVLLANLSEKVIRVLEITFNKKYYWSDSMVTLAWIRGSPSRWKVFVGNRVSEIQTITEIEDWNHISSEENPADVLSRGVAINGLIEHKLWWHGPTFLERDQSEWELGEQEHEGEIPEQKLVVGVMQNIENEIFYIIRRISSFNKMQRVVAYVLRFIFNSRLENARLRQGGALETQELIESRNVLIRQAQRECFAEEFKDINNNKVIAKHSTILALNPFVQNDLLRVGGRLRNAKISFDKRYPIILPRSHILTSLILKAEHERLLHCGSQALLCSIRETYWPIGGRNVCKQAIRKCFICFKAKPKETTYLMGDLPKVRVNNYSPFLNVGIDYGGPFSLKDRKTRGAKILKAYICLFVCMSTKACHIELVSELTTEAFLAALNRFTARRGRPSNIYSDNGSNFVGANNEISKLFEFVNQNNNIIKNNLANEHISWHFIPPRSPTFGGIWEAGIKSVKHHIKRVINFPIVFEDFSTLLVRIEGILNSRPLCPLTEDPDDLSALTPAHFLIGRTLTALPENPLTEVPENRLRQWQRVKAMTQHYWTRWNKEYLAELQTRVKWKTKACDLIKVGALVLIKNEHVSSMQWQLGRIVRVHPGKDNIIRVVDIKVHRGELTRAVNRICVLPNE